MLAILLVSYFAFAKCWVPEMENPGLYQGDIVLNPEQLMQVRNGTFPYSSTNNPKRLWPNGVVPYEIASILQSNKEFMSEFQHSIEQYHKYTCLRFKKRKNERGYIYFSARGGCSSLLGYQSNKQEISLSKGCWWRSSIMHEIGHALGFHHEQCRPDRDNYVTILNGNVIRGLEYNFEKQKGSEVDSKGTTYDYHSMMHYAWDAFGSGKMTIKTKDPAMQYEIGNGMGDQGFSHIDIEQIQKVYQCSGTYPTLPDTYVNPTPDCHDLRPCAQAVFKGHCKLSIWKYYLSKNCKKSCGFCSPGPLPSKGPEPSRGPQTTQRLYTTQIPRTTQRPYTTQRPRTTQRPQTTKAPYTTQKPSPTNGGGSDCKDKVTDCSSFGRRMCTTSMQVWREYMETNCQKYCNKC